MLEWLAQHALAVTVLSSALLNARRPSPLGAVTTLTGLLSLLPKPFQKLAKFFAIVAFAMLAGPVSHLPWVTLLFELVRWILYKLVVHTILYSHLASHTKLLAE